MYLAWQSPARSLSEKKWISKCTDLLAHKCQNHSRCCSLGSIGHEKCEGETWLERILLEGSQIPWPGNSCPQLCCFLRKHSYSPKSPTYRLKQPPLGQFSQSMVLRLAAASSPGNWLEMQIIRPHTNIPSQKPEGSIGPALCISPNPLGASDVSPSLRTPAIGDNVVMLWMFYWLL